MSLLSQKLLKWFNHSGRFNLPWQQDINAYRVWVSEIMLQQTQVTTVIPYYEKFIKLFPTIFDLNKASLDEVLSMWAGLGYYSRARNLYQTAQILVQEYGGVFPQDIDKVMALPGIGRSTAGAILSIAYNISHPILDGNVKRVLARFFAIKDNIKSPDSIKQLWKLAAETTPKNKVDKYTQAIMDLGALICTRSKPKCEICPLTKDCQAYQTNEVMYYPKVLPKALKPIRQLRLLMIKINQQFVLLEKRPLKGIWGGLWSLPECALNQNIINYTAKHFELKITKPILLSPFRHTFTHYHLDIHPVIINLNLNESNLNKLINHLSDNYHLKSFDKLSDLAFPAPIKKLLFNTFTFKENKCLELSIA
ncbi:MAG: adenine glycosylase [Francisellaceae bacterium]|nr:adenine glycosylase [Francisellaceae bacterium]